MTINASRGTHFGAGSPRAGVLPTGFPLGPGGLTHIAVTFCIERLAGPAGATTMFWIPKGRIRETGLAGIDQLDHPDPLPIRLKMQSS
jgi:hypothetical protein